MTAELVTANQQASHDLEKIAIQAKEVVNLLRDGTGPWTSYALVYELRARMSRVVAQLGVGVPEPGAGRTAREILDSVV